MPPAPSTGLAVRDLAVIGLQPVSFHLAPGEIVALVGPSGSGKSLLLRAVADLDGPTVTRGGAVSLDGVARDAVPAPDWRRRAVYVAATPGWWADGVATHFADPAAGAAIAVRFGLPPDVMTWSVGRLSTGEAQRLALARALALTPPLLLLDEPTAALDVETTFAVERVLITAAAAGTAILLVSHDPAQAVRLCRRRLRINNGGLVAEPISSAGTGSP